MARRHMVVLIYILLIIAGELEAMDHKTIKGLFEDFYETISIPVDRLQNLYRANLAPTLWCGIRNVAPFPDALSAIYPHLDSCCRSHDQCDVQIERGECFEDICNPSFLTPILSCECETEFRDCLKSLPTASSLPDFPITWAERLLTDLTGLGYFGILPRILEHKCILRLSNPECEENYFDDESGTCLEYKNNGTWSLISLHRDFNHREWFNPDRYVADVIDTRELEAFLKRFMDGYYIGDTTSDEY